MKNENYIVIQGWMINDLELKGNELICYAIIYGFSQDGESEFKGSLNYLCKILKCSKQTVITILKSLVENGLIEKINYSVQSVQFNKYKVVEVVKNLDGGVKNLEGGSQNIIEGGSQKIRPYNNNINNNIDNTNLFDVLPISHDVLKYLNQKKPSNRPFEFTASNLKPIESRIKEKFVLSDFKKVIDYKVAQWSEDVKMAKYIRPETLFGDKFNSYLVESETVLRKKDDGSENFEYNPKAKAELI